MDIKEKIAKAIFNCERSRDEAYWEATPYQLYWIRMAEAIIPIIEAEVKAERLHIGAMVCIAKNELGWGFPPEEYIEITEKLQPIIEYCGKDLKEEVE